MCCCSGYIDTDMTQALLEKIFVMNGKTNLARRLGTVEDIAGMFLAEAKYVTGQVLNVNGGLYMCNLLKRRKTMEPSSNYRNGSNHL